MFYTTISGDEASHRVGNLGVGLLVALLVTAIFSGLFMCLRCSLLASESQSGVKVNMDHSAVDGAVTVSSEADDSVHGAL